MKLQSMRRSQKAAWGILFSLFILAYGCRKNDHPPKATNESAGVVYDWYKLILRLQLNTSPPVSGILNNNNFGYIGVGLYEAVRPGIKGSESLSSKLYQMPSMPSADAKEDYLWRASANAALAGLTRVFSVGLTDESKASIDSLENAYNQRLQAENNEAFTRSQAFGRSVATAIYEWSNSDSFKLSNAGYVPPVFPGAWEPTPPTFANAAGPYVKNARPFLESNLSPATPPLRIPYAEDKTSEFYKAAKEVYDISNTLTPEQKETANLWADVGGVGKGYPVPGHAVSIVTQVLEKKSANLGEAAQIYAKTSIVYRDAVIVLWKQKYHYNLLRPVTYIKRFIDTGWLPFVPTPPYPEYPSAIAFIYGGVMQVLTREFGDNIPVTDNTYAWNGSTPRQYASFSKLAEEAAISRLYAGIHYKFSIEDGLEMGKKLGDQVAGILPMGY